MACPRSAEGQAAGRQVIHTWRLVHVISCREADSPGMHTVLPPHLLHGCAAVFDSSEGRMMRTLFVRRCPNHNTLLRFALGLCAAVLIVLLLVLPDESQAATGFLWRDNCYANMADANRAFAEEQVVPTYFWDTGVLYKRWVNYASNTLQYWENMGTVNLSNGTVTYIWSRVLQTSEFYICTIPDNMVGLSGNGTPSIFSPIYEMARTLVNTQELMIFLWAVATFFLGFKFGYFVFNSGGGKHDTF